VGERREARKSGCFDEHWIHGDRERHYLNQIGFGVS
jgi:hypothetical protein